MAIEIKLADPITFRFTENGEQVCPPWSMSGLTLYKTLKGEFEKEKYTKPIKDIYIALSRAIEEGDQLKIGIVLGQTVSKLEELTNN